MAEAPLVTVAVPSFNQGRYLADALESIFVQGLPVEVFVADGGSSDDSVRVVERFAPQLAGWRSHPDRGQSAAVNECIARGSAPYVCWLNSDDMLLPGGLLALVRALEANPDAPAVYGRVWNINESTGEKSPVWVEPFEVSLLAFRCIISQPGTLIRRTAWDAVGGLDEGLQMSLDYDLWWRLFKQAGPLFFLDEFVAVNREHENTKTSTNRRQYYLESMGIIRKYSGRLPIRWRISFLKYEMCMKTKRIFNRK